MGKTQKSGSGSATSEGGRDTLLANFFNQFGLEGEKTRRFWARLVRLKNFWVRLGQLKGSPPPYCQLFLDVTSEILQQSIGGNVDCRGWKLPQRWASRTQKFSVRTSRTQNLSSPPVGPTFSIFFTFFSQKLAAEPDSDFRDFSTYETKFIS